VSESFKPGLSAGTTRRTFLQLIAAAGATVGTGVITGCSATPSSPSSKSSQPAANLGQLAAKQPVEGSISWAANSGEVSPKDVARFSKQTGVHVNYREVIADADQFFASVKPELSAGLPIGWDVICLSTQYVDVYAQQGWLETPDPAALPNVHKYLVPELRDVPYVDLAIPFDYGALGIMYSKKLIPNGLGSWADLLDPAVHGRVALYSTPLPNIAAWGLYLRAQKKIDNTPDKMTVQEGLAVIAFLRPYIKSGQLRTSSGENYVQSMAAGDLAAAIGAPVNVAEISPKLIGFTVPTEGAPAYIDRLAIPKGAKNPRAAEALMNWWYEPFNATRFCEYTLEYPYATGVQALMKTVDPKLANNSLIFPSAAVRSQLYPYPAPWTLAEIQQLTSAWATATNV
jgi:spermidine/putrescine transport system substrate-binding protein